LQEFGERGTQNAFSERGRDAARNKNIFGHS
jgi:hypothetical protein